MDTEISYSTGLFILCMYFACMSVHHMPAWCRRGQKRASDPLGLEYRARNRWGQLCSSILNCLLTLCRPSLRARGCYCRPHLKLESSSWTGPSLSQHGPKCSSDKTGHIRGQCTYNQVPLLLLKGKEIISLFQLPSLRTVARGPLQCTERQTADGQRCHQGLHPALVSVFAPQVKGDFRV